MKSNIKAIRAIEHKENDDNDVILITHSQIMKCTTNPTRYRFIARINARTLIVGITSSGVIYSTDRLRYTGLEIRYLVDECEVNYHHRNILYKKLEERDATVVTC